MERLSIPGPGSGLKRRLREPSYQQKVPGKAVTSFFSLPHLPEIPGLWAVTAREAQGATLSCPAVLAGQVP